MRVKRKKKELISTTLERCKTLTLLSKTQHDFLVIVMQEHYDFINRYCEINSTIFGVYEYFISRTGTYFMHFDYMSSV